MNWIFSKFLKDKATNRDIRMGNQDEFGGMIFPTKPVAVTDVPVEFTSDVDFNDATVTGLPDSRPYKVYTALLTPLSLAADDVIILENTLGEVPSWTVNSSGNYTMATLGDIFTPFKTEIIAPLAYNDGGTIRPINMSVESQTMIGLYDDNEQPIDLWHGTNFSANSTSYFRFEVRVYN